MHQPFATPHPSIYFNYKVYPAAPCPEADAIEPVLIVGAGPVGLTTALLLAKAGVRSVVLESEQQVCSGSRAIAFTRRSLEILQQTGAHRAFEALGLPWGCGNSFYRGKQVFRMETPHDPHDRFAPLTNLQQQFVEEALIEEVAKTPLVEIRWAHKVVRVLRRGTEGSTEDVFAALEIDTPQGPYVQRAHYVVACDGARSTLRSLLDLKLEGSSYEGRFVIADIRIKLPLPTERLAFFDPVWNPGNTVLMHREPLDMWRIDYQLPPGESPEEALRPESLTARINAQLAMIGHGGIPWEMDWSSVYSARALTLPNYRHGHILFAGDAAHLLPIFGVRGANTGFQDAQNLAWKLALVVKGKAPLALLDSYSHERVAAAREIVHEAGKSTRFMTPPTRGFRLLRDAVLSLSLTQAFVRPLYHWRTSRAHAYGDSPLNASVADTTALDSALDDNALFVVTGLAAGVRVGEPMANVALGPDDFLMDHFPAGFLLLVVGQDSATPLPADVQSMLADFRARGHVIAVQHNHHAEVVARYAGPEGTGVYLFRPDQHVCARWLALDTNVNVNAMPAARRIELALNRAVGMS
jgi:3-(3-hydroxy-phenyl)propionate hydroxylase